MRICVTFKIYSDLSNVKLKDLEITEEMGVDTHFLPNTINCYDESSLEFAIRLSEKNENIINTALTISNDGAKPTLKSLLALGYNHVVCIMGDSSDFKFSPNLVAHNIVKYIENNPNDVIIIGKEAPLGNNAATAQLVSKKLNFPLISSVIDIKKIKKDSLIVLIENNNSIYQQEVKIPCVLSMGNAVISKLRMPTLKERMKNKTREIEMFDFIDSKEPSYLYPLRIYKPERKRESSFSKTSEEIKEYLSNEFVSKVKEL